VELDEYRTLGRSGLRVSPLALGTMAFGDPSWGSDAETSFAIIQGYLEAGGNFIDTANGYAEGESERIIGNYLSKSPGLRDRVVVSTKFARNMYPGDPNGGGSGRKAIVEQVHASLDRLGTDYIDIYWQHCWDQHTPIEETVSTLNDMVTAGKIRYLGVSNTPAWAVTHAIDIATFRGWATFVGLQVEYSLLRRTVEGELFGAARQFGLGVTPYSPLASGVLSGKYSRANRTPEGSGRGKLAAAQLAADNAFDVLDELQEIAGELDAAVAAVALAWVRQQPEVTSALIGARTVEQLQMNLGSLAVTIPAGGLARLDAVSKPDLNYPFPWLATIAAPLQQSGATVNGVPTVHYERKR
jgi:aryl-alcohol dehydrogenase-like predicted oxidoreductase